MLTLCNTLFEGLWDVIKLCITQLEYFRYLLKEQLRDYFREKHSKGILISLIYFEDPENGTF